MKKAVFVDRDGTVSVELGYIRAEDTHKYALEHGAAEGLKALGDAGWTRVLVTNQSGVARGYYPVAQLNAVHAKLKELLAAGGAGLEAIYYCPHHPDPFSKPDTGEDAPGMSRAEPVKELAVDCDCRKPKPGMGLRAAKELGLDMRASWMVGDKAADAGFAESLGLRFVLVRTGYGEKTFKKLTAEGRAPAHVAADLGEAARIILKESV